MEFTFKGIGMKLQTVSGEDTYREVLETKGIRTYQVEESRKVAKGIGSRVMCDKYKYTSPVTNKTLFVYEYIESWDGNAECGYYVAATENPVELDIFELYDTIMELLKE